MNLRQTNKANRQKLIVATAARLFSSIGYEKTAIELVAERPALQNRVMRRSYRNTRWNQGRHHYGSLLDCL